MRSGEVKKIIVHQVEHTRMNTAKHRTPAERHQEPKHNRRTAARAREEDRTRSISAHPSDVEEDFAQETPEAALLAAQAYLLTT
jgi:hypothetical protein